MPDEYGVPLPDQPDDYQQFMLAMFDLIEQASDIQASSDAVELLKQARDLFLDEFEKKYPGLGQGRAVWRLPP